MKSDLKVFFCDFWIGFDSSNNIFIDSLNKSYNVYIVDVYRDDIDLVIYSNFGDFNRSIKVTKKLYYSGENDFPDFNRCDYAISHNILDYNRHFRLPLWCLYMSDNKLSDEYLGSEYFNRKFCSSVISNSNNSSPDRFDLINSINSICTIDNGGSYMNNIGGCVSDKSEFISKYKFNIAAENSYVDGYVTEKILEAFQSKTIPIYFGSDYVKKDFNINSFIYVNDFNNMDDLLLRIMEINNNESLYSEMLNYNKFNSNDYYQTIIKEFDNFLINVIKGGLYEHKYGKVGLLQ